MVANDSIEEFNEIVAKADDIDAELEVRKPEAEFSVDSPVPDIVESIKSGDKEATDLSPDGRFVVIKYLKEAEKQSSDQIAKELRISRRTVFNYYKKIKEHNAHTLMKTTVPELGGEIYQMGKEAMAMALKMGRPKDFAYVAQNLITILQSMGIVPKIPQRSQVEQNITQDISVRAREGFAQLQRAANENDEITIDAVFEELLDYVKNESTEGEENGNTKHSKKS